MTVAPIEKSEPLTGNFNTSSSAVVITKDSGDTQVHPDGKELPERFKYIKPEKSAGLSFSKTPCQQKAACYKALRAINQFYTDNNYCYYM